MKRFAVMAYDNYYPCGGFGNLVASFDTVSDALTFASACSSDNVEVWSVEAVSQNSEDGLVYRSYRGRVELSKGADESHPGMTLMWVGNDDVDNVLSSATYAELVK